MRIISGRKLVSAVVIAAAAALGAAAVPGVAATTTVYNVNTTADGNLATHGSNKCIASSASPANGKCSLRAAIQAAANVATGNVRINVPKGVYKLTVNDAPPAPTLHGGLLSAPTALDITGNSGNPNEIIAIVGAAPATTIVDANFTDRAFNIESGSTVSISRMTIEHGRVGGVGPGSTCPSTPPAGGDGGAILDDGTLTLTHDVVKDNMSAGFGGGVDNEEFKPLKIAHTTITRNTNCQNSDNVEAGGAVSTDDEGPLNIVSSTISHNTVTGGLGEGGGISEDNGEPSNVTITGSTISHNSAQNGGGVAADGDGGSFKFFADVLSHNTAAGLGGGFGNFGGDTDTFVNTTVANNSATQDGGGIFSQNGNETLQFATIADNSSTSGTGNLSFQVPDGFTLDNSIVVRGQGGANGNCNGPTGFTDNGYNMFDDTSDNGAQCGSSAGKHDVITANPKVGTLGNHFGPTQTVPLLLGSPAINTANGTACMSETKDSAGHQVDQRSVPRPQDLKCDIGAFEATPDLGISSSPDKNLILVGQQDTVTDTIVNTGPAGALDSTLTDPAAGYKIDSVNTTQGTCSHTSTSVSCQFGRVPPGGHVTVSLVLTALSKGTITLHGRTSTSGDDLDQANNHTTTSIRVKSKPKPPPPPPPTPGKPKIKLARLSPACYRTSSTIHFSANAKAPAGIRSVTITLAGRTIQTYRPQGQGKPPTKRTVSAQVNASSLTGHSYTVRAKVIDTRGRSAQDSADFTVCRPPKRGFTG